MKFLELSLGRCSQDSLFIKKIDKLPNFVQKRTLQNITECAALENNELLCFFADGSTKIVELDKLPDSPDLNKIKKNSTLFKSCKVGADGFFITFNDSIDIPSNVLYKYGKHIPIKYSYFISFINTNILDTADSCRKLDCTRQNLAYMAKQKYLSPIKEDVKGNLYMKGQVEKNMW